MDIIDITNTIISSKRKIKIDRFTKKIVRFRIGIIFSLLKGIIALIKVLKTNSNISTIYPSIIKDKIKTQNVDAAITIFPISFITPSMF